LRFLGLELGTRMTLIRLPGSRLLLHSPIAYSRELAAQVEALGSPAFLVAPNRFHHLYAADWQSAYPTCRLYAAPGLETKRPDLAISGTLGVAPVSDWSNGVAHVLVEGFPLVNEVVLFHEPSRTLVATDLLFNLGPDSPALTRVAFRLAGAYGRPSATLLERLMIRDRAAFRRSLARVLDWQISRIVVAHGKVVEFGAKDALAKAYSWILS
jgi:hypothetical protein